MQKNNKPAMIRLPKELFEKIEQRQKKNRRSLNQEVIFMLCDYLDLTRNKSEAPVGNTKNKPVKRIANLTTV